LAASLWRTRQPEELLLQLQAPGAQPLAFRARFTFRDSENLVPEIAIYLERTEGVSDHAVAALLDKLYGTHPTQAVALVDTEGVLHWQNTHFAQLFQTHTHRVPTAAVLKHFLEDRQLALELHTRIAQGQQLRQEVSLYLDNRSIPAQFYLEPLGEVSPGHLLLRLDFGSGSKQQDTQLQLAEQKLQSMVEGAPVGICVTDEHGILESVNEAYCFIYGYRKEELIGQHFTKMVPSSQVDAWKKAHARFIDGKQDTRGEFTVMDKEGRERIVMSDSTRTLGLDGRPRKITFVLDITEQKRQERELRTSEDRLMRIFETAPFGICITSPSGNFEVINDAYSRMYGYSKEELVGQPFTKIVPPSQISHWNTVHDKFIAGQTETRGEFTVRHKNGHDMIVLAESTRITGSDGQPRKVTFVLDITGSHARHAGRAATLRVSLPQAAATRTCGHLRHRPARQLR
jgi:PAS domain S-box-containing protein